jgi:hypothetical protein
MSECVERTPKQAARNGIRRVLRSADSAFESRGVPRGSKPEFNEEEEEEEGRVSTKCRVECPRARAECRAAQERNAGAVDRRA